MSTTAGVAPLIPEAVEAALKPHFRNLSILGSTGAVVTRNNLPGEPDAGQTIKIPRFSKMGPLQKPAENADLTIRTLTASEEDAIVGRYGDAAQLSVWAKNAASEDIEGEIARQWTEMVEEGIATDLIAACVADNTSTGGGTLPTYATTGAGAAALSFKEINLAKQSIYGDELDGFVALGMSSLAYTELMNQENSNGDPRVQPPAAGESMSKYYGLDIIVSDLFTDGESMLFKKGALAFWYQQAPMVETDRLILSHSTVMAINFYGVAHRYDKLNGSNFGGVVQINHS